MVQLLGRVRRKMLSAGLPAALLDDLSADGVLPRRQHPQAQVPGMTGDLDITAVQRPRGV